MKRIFITAIMLLLLFPMVIIAQENTAITCSDGIDNDGDGLIDCLDDDCANLPTDMDRGCQTCFFDGRSFVDTVIAYTPTCPTNEHTNPQKALGVADWAAPGDEVSLGEGGSITLGFVNNLLINSGNSQADIWFFEVGPRVENCRIELRPANQNTKDRLDLVGISDNDGNGFYDFGIIANQISFIDIDAVISGFGFAELKFDAVKITDIPQICGGPNPGADIDAVCALTSIDVETDCAGVPNGMAILDSCGVCLEPTDSNFNQSCIDCAGVINGIAILDSCGVCLEPNDPDFNQACLDCAGIPNGTAIIDSCGVCLESTDPTFNQSCVDCAGMPNGMAILDSCGICLLPSDPNFNQSCLDCTGTPNGLAILDSCGVCLELTDPNFNQSCIDCAGVINGLAVLDSCGICLELNDSSFNQSCLDCANTPNGTAILDNCGVCLEPDAPDFNQTCLGEPQFYIPNAFSPNGDGKNDLFEIFKPRELNATINTYLIFNRWGSLVYRANSFDFGTNGNWWDGTFNREKMENGIYLYFIEVEIQNVGIKKYEGIVAIIN